jgi:hypothetical protein
MSDFLDIIHRHIFVYNNVSETGICFHPQVRSLFSWVQSIELVPISGNLLNPGIGTSSMGWVQLSRLFT